MCWDTGIQIFGEVPINDEIQKFHDNAQVIPHLTKAILK